MHWDLCTRCTIRGRFTRCLGKPIYALGIWFIHVLEAIQCEFIDDFATACTLLQKTCERVTLEPSFK